MVTSAYRHGDLNIWVLSVSMAITTVTLRVLSMIHYPEEMKEWFQMISQSEVPTNVDLRRHLVRFSLVINLFVGFGVFYIILALY